MLKFHLLIYLILLFKVSEVNSGNCCIRPRALYHHETTITEHAVIEEIEQGEAVEDARFAAEIDKFYESRPEMYKGEKETAIELDKAMEEAGPSTITLPTRVMAPDESQTIKFVEAIMRAFDTITDNNSDPILLLREAKDILDQILSKINFVCMNDQGSTPFFAAIASVSTKHCNALVQRGISPTISSRTMNAIFAPEDSFNSYNTRRSEIGEETDGDDLISDIQNREKIINVCQIGVYLAMCNLILDIKLKNKKINQKIKEVFVNKMKSLSKYNYAWNEAVEIIQGNEYELMQYGRLGELNLNNLQVVIKNGLKKPKMKKKKNLH